MPDNLTIRTSFAQARRETRARHRDIAHALGLAEGQLIAAHVGASTEGLAATTLRGPWPDLIEALAPVGEVMALTRNAACVHEKTGVYRNATHNGTLGLVLGGAIDLRLFYGRWAHGYAVDEPTAHGPQRSLQFYDAAGVAIHKIFMRATTDRAAWDAVVAQHADPLQRAELAVTPPPPPDPERPDHRIDIEAFRIGWAAMTDTHEFFALLRRHGVSRTQALRLADPDCARPVPPALVQRVLQDAAREAVPIMVFVGNPGMIQIHGGPVQRVEVLGPWLNVFDPGFNLHLRTDQIAGAWVVRKPTHDGVVTSLELFDAQGETIAMLFGERKPGQVELPQWRRLVEDALAQAGGVDSCPA